MSRKITLKEILVENSTYTNTHRLKIKLLESGMLKKSCFECGLGEVWNGIFISLHLDHVNGINNDHRIENIRILCPNCHSQTATYAGKNTTGKRKKAIKEKKNRHCEDCNVQIWFYGVNKKCRSCVQKKIHKQNNITLPESLEVLLKHISDLGYRGTGRIYGVSDNAIRKWVKKMSCS